MLCIDSITRPGDCGEGEDYDVESNRFPTLCLLASRRIAAKLTDLTPSDRYAPDPHGARLHGIRDNRGEHGDASVGVSWHRAGGTQRSGEHLLGTSTDAAGAGGPRPNYGNRGRAVRGSRMQSPHLPPLPGSYVLSFCFGTVERPPCVKAKVSRPLRVTIPPTTSAGGRCPHRRHSEQKLRGGCWMLSWQFLPM